MSSNPTGVKQYQMVRDYLSWIYLYGYFSREDFSRLLPKKAASFDVCIKYIKDIYPELMDGRYREKKKYLALDRAAQPSDEDRLANTFFLSSLADKELAVVLQLLQELAPSSARAAAMTYTFDDTASASTLRRRMDELVQIGYLDQDCERRFTVHADPLRSLTDEELTNLYRFVRFCGNITYPRIPARFLLRSVEREYLYRGLPLDQTSYFRFLNNPNHNVMDEDLVFTLLELIRKRYRAKITVRRGGAEKIHLITPISLRLDKRLGRWYLLAMEECPIIYRLTRVQKVSPAGKCPAKDWTEAKAAVDTAFAHSRFSSFLPKGGPRRLEMELRFDNPGLERQFLRELRGGVIETEDGRRVYRDEINDPIELVPLLRSYAPWLVPSNPEGVAERRIREDLFRMRQQLTEEMEL